MIQKQDLFVAGTNGYITYRVPALVTSTTGTILAFCEGRNSDVRVMGGDCGDIEIVLRRSFDNGKSWEPMQVVVDNGTDTAGNPAPVVDAETGTIWLLFCKNLTEGPEDLIVQGKAPRTAWVTSSRDDGATWAEPVEITDAVKDPSWTWYATGPCHGIQTKSGRLVVPCDHTVGKVAPYHDVASSVAVLGASGYSHVIYSDDHGGSWQIGGRAGQGTNECNVVQTVDGALYLNSRNYVGEQRRATAWSNDEGNSFEQIGWDETLVEPICQGSIVRYTEAATHGRNRVLFANPASTRRERMTVRLSYDECRTWTAGKVLHSGRAAYSDLCVAHDMTICCVFDCGENSAYEKETVARFDLEWLTDGAETLDWNE